MILEEHCLLHFVVLTYARARFSYSRRVCLFVCLSVRHMLKIMTMGQCSLPWTLVAQGDQLSCLRSQGNTQSDGFKQQWGG